MRVRTTRSAWTWPGAFLLVACSNAPSNGGSSTEGGTGNGGQTSAGGSTGSGGAIGSGGTAVGVGGNGAVASGGGGSGGITTSRDGSFDDSGTVPGTPPSGFVYVSGYGPDISILPFHDGTLQPGVTVAAGVAPSYLAVAPDKQHLYAVNEASGADSRVIAFSVDPATGQLTELDREATGGNGSPHLAVHPSGKWIAVAHYTSGQTSILPIQPDGSLGPTTDVDKGPSDGCDKAHQAVFDSSGTHLFVPCLGSNYVIQYAFADGKLTYNNPATVLVAGGPRHLALHPDGKHAYVLSELSSTITTLDYDAAAGTLANPESIPSYQTTAGSSAHVVVHPSGKWLYVSNRGENSLGRFSIDASGKPHPVDFVTKDVHTPRDFSIDAAGAFLVLANQEGTEDLLLYRIDPSTGALDRVQRAAVGGNPTFTTTVYF